MDNIVQTLRTKCVKFEHYEMSDTLLRGDVHISGEMRAASFKDPEGNILSLFSSDRKCRGVKETVSDAIPPLLAANDGVLGPGRQRRETHPPCYVSARTRDRILTS